MYILLDADFVILVLRVSNTRLLTSGIMKIVLPPGALPDTALHDYRGKGLLVDLTFPDPRAVTHTVYRHRYYGIYPRYRYLVSIVFFFLERKCKHSSRACSHLYRMPSLMCNRQSGGYDSQTGITTPVLWRTVLRTVTGRTSTPTETCSPAGESYSRVWILTSLLRQLGMFCVRSFFTCRS